MIFIAAILNDKYHLALFNSSLEEVMESLNFRVNLPAVDLRSFLVGNALSNFEGHCVFGEKVSNRVGDILYFNEIAGGYDGILVDGMEILVFSRENNEVVPLHKFKTSEELEKDRKEQIHQKFVKVHNIIKTCEDFKEFKKFLEIAEDHYDEVNVAEIEEFQEPFAVICHESTETDFDGWDIDVLDATIIYRSSFE